MLLEMSDAVTFIVVLNILMLFSLTAFVGSRLNIVARKVEDLTAKLKSASTGDISSVQVPGND